MRRANGKHRAMDPEQLKTALDEKNNTCADLRLCCERLGRDYKQLQDAYYTALADLNAERAAHKTKLATLTAELGDAQADVRRLTADMTALRATVQPRDTTDPRDQATAPMDMRQLRDDTADDYFDHSRQTWHGPIVPVLPLWQAHRTGHKPTPPAADREVTQPIPRPTAA